MFKILLCTLVLFPCIALAETITVAVGGMTCVSCSRALNEAFSELPEVAHVNADHKLKKVIITTKDKQTLADSVIQRIVTEEGYSVDGIVRS